MFLIELKDNRGSPDWQHPPPEKRVQGFEGSSRKQERLLACSICNSGVEESAEDPPSAIYPQIKNTNPRENDWLFRALLR